MYFANQVEIQAHRSKESFCSCSGCPSKAYLNCTSILSCRSTQRGSHCTGIIHAKLLYKVLPMAKTSTKLLRTLWHWMLGPAQDSQGRLTCYDWHCKALSSQKLTLDSAAVCNGAFNLQVQKKDYISLYLLLAPKAECLKNWCQHHI